MSRETESIFLKYIEQMPEGGGSTPSWESTQMFNFRTSKSWPKYFLLEIVMKFAMLNNANWRKSEKLLNLKNGYTVREGWFNFILSWSESERCNTFASDCGNRQK